MSPQIMEIEGLAGIESLKNPTEYKECNVGIIQKITADKVVDHWTGALYGPRSEFESYFQEACTKMGKQAAEQIVFVTDGAKHNWAFCSKWLPHAIQILDFYHATEHVTAFCESSWDEAALKKAKYVHLTGLIYQGQILNALVEMRADLKKLKTPSAREAAQKEVNYFESNQHRMEYDRYREQGFPIGSGVIESACKLVVGKRFKGNGMRWKKEDNQNVLNTRLAVMNNCLSHEFERKPNQWRLKAS